MSTEKTLWIVGGAVAGAAALSVVAFVVAQKIARDAAQSAIQNAADATTRNVLRVGQSVARSYQWDSPEAHCVGTGGAWVNHRCVRFATTTTPTQRA